MTGRGAVQGEAGSTGVGTRAGPALCYSYLWPSGKQKVGNRLTATFLQIKSSLIINFAAKVAE